MTPVETIPEGKVVAVCADHKHRFSKAPRLSIRLIAGHGIEGDVHAGPFVKHRFLARRNPRAPNFRQVHLIAAELLQALQGAGHHVERGELGENITAAGIDLETLPLDTELRIGGGTLRLAGLRTPCVLIDRFQSGLKALLIVPRPQPQFRAGVLAIVTGGGIVVPGRRHPGHPAASVSTRAPCHLKAGFDRRAASPDRPVGSLLSSADRSA